MKTLQIVGRKNVGKTTLLARLVPPLKAAGLRVGSVKHCSHPYPLDREGTDSWHHRRAGTEATMVITSADASLHVSLDADERAPERLLERLLGDLDLVLIEGWAERQDPKIEVVPGDGEGGVLAPKFLGSGKLMAVVLGPGLAVEAGAMPAWGRLVEGRGRGAGLAPSVSSGAADVAPLVPGAEPVPCYGWDEVEALAAAVLARVRA